MFEVYIDGASAGNPGCSGAGIFIKGNKVVEEYSIPLGYMNNHQAEFHALIHALEICHSKKYSVVSIRTDSKIVCDSIEKKFVKRDEFKPLLQKVLTMIESFDLFFIKWIPEKKNRHADRLARAAIHKN
ncbi:reverse transcriptase-like protein [Caldibacillus thermolactis]|jgi:ribonuclease HI|uniref:Reverse transcriptase-like protein n=1 Tax=Pallidibacillus thermolactis TaxID=251051 RepID=A0ABT2WHW9_9BACI|nr:reverse transcriptase-like protein [Pallidibacillus thermolactis]MCU9593642.1 reverse transcriptase-like protein [Pallidibacillus thermolactis]